MKKLIKVVFPLLLKNVMRYLFAGLVLITSTCIVSAFNFHQEPESIREELKKHYDHFKVEGSFILFDQNKKCYTFYNKCQTTQPFSPASTFKICNSLIGLETGVIKDKNFVIPWDSVIRQNPKWNKDHDLESAFRNSTVWYYRELARRVGAEKMEYWLKKSGYGNMDMSGGLDLFWLHGGLRITPREQIYFLRRLHDNKLPFSKRSTDIVKEIMIVDKTADYVLRAKTGWADEPGRIVGWYIGYIEKSDNVYYFATCIQSANANHPDFGAARVEITNNILQELQIIP